MPRQVTQKWGSFTDLRDLDQDTLCCCCCNRPVTTSSAPPTPPPPPPPQLTLSPQKHPRPQEYRRMSEPRQQLPQTPPQNRHRPLTRLNQLQREGDGSGVPEGGCLSSAVGRYSLSPPRLFPPAELPPAGRLRRVFTTHTRRRKKHSHGFQLSSLMKEPLRVVHSVPLCFPEG